MEVSEHDALVSGIYQNRTELGRSMFLAQSRLEAIICGATMRCSHRYMIIYQSVGDTTGPGGMMRALRHTPALLKIATLMDRYGPEDVTLIQNKQRNYQPNV